MESHRIPRYRRRCDRGEWIASVTDETVAVRNPADTDDVVSEVQKSSDDDAEAAVEAAAAAQEEWANTPGPERGAVLRRTGDRLAERKDELVELLSREEGKTPDEATPEV